MDAGPREPGGGAPSPFATGYAKGSGDAMVYGGGAVTLVGVLAAALTGNPAFLGLSLLGTLSAFYYAPVVNPQVPQLGADASGVYVARVGLIDWHAVADMRVERRTLRTMALATLVLRLDRPLAEALLRPEPVGWPLRWTARNVRVRGTTVRVELHTLAMPPDGVETRLRALRAAAGR